MILLRRYEYNPKEDLIGTGGFSRVYKAFDKKLNRWVALKIYKTNDLSEKYNPISEIQRVADLDHPNICRYLDIDEVELENAFGEKEDIQICVMELLDGGNIAKYYETHNDPALLKKFILDTLHGLSYLHRKGIIHRDIKPANILIKQQDDGPVAKITDFGISKMSDAPTNNSSSALIVSVPYLAPEQLNPEKYSIDEKIAFNLDIWTLGVAVYEIITGYALFKSDIKDTPEVIMLNIQSTDLDEKIKRLPQPFRAFVTECLVRDAKLRVKTTEALIPVLTADYPPDVITEKVSFFLEEVSAPVEDLNIEKESEDTTRIIPKPAEENRDLDAKRIIPKPVSENETTGIPSIKEPENADHTKILTPGNFKEPISDDQTKILNKGLSEEPVPDDQTQVLNPQNSANEKANSDETKILYGTTPDTNTTGLFQKKEGPMLLFNRYEYVPSHDLIGRGGFSRVYKAYDQKLNRWVALKVYKSGEFSDRYSAISEIRRVINLDHSNICRYLDMEEIDKVNHFGENEKIQVCVMELLDGGNFAEYYKSNKDPEILKKLIRGILNGLSYLHKNAIIHRDIKPANILIKKTIEGPVAKITDFGISKVSDSVNSNSSSALIVSIPYMAPEQLNPKKYGVNEKISYNLDLWSLGVTIYEVYTGNVLFKNNEQENSEQIMNNIMSPGLPEKINELPEPFRNVVAHCIVKNANDRAQKADELLVLLDGPGTFTTPTYHTAENLDQITTLISAKKPGFYDTKKLPETQRDDNTTQKLNNADAPAATRTKPGIRLNYLQIAIGIGIIFVLMIVFLFIKSSRMEKIVSHDPERADSTQIVKVQPATADTTHTLAPVLPPAPLPAAKDSVKETVHTDPKKVPTHKTDHPAEKKKEPVAIDQKQEQPQHATPVINGSQKYVLELTTTQTCTIKINGMDIGTLETGKTMKVYLKPGKYLLLATSTSDASAVYTGNLQVDQDNINEVGKLKIRL